MYGHNAPKEVPPALLVIFSLLLLICFTRAGGPGYWRLQQFARTVLVVGAVSLCPPLSFRFRLWRSRCPPSTVVWGSLFIFGAAVLRAINETILTVFGPSKFSRVVSNNATDATPGGALPSILVSFSVATILSQRPTNIDFSAGAEGVIKQTTSQSQVGMVYGSDYGATSMPSVSFVLDR